LILPVDDDVDKDDGEDEDVEERKADRS